jgi:medium-chain acyl-CoA synthetase
MEVKRGSMGRAVPGVPLHIIDEDGRIVEDEKEGDIAIKTMDEHGKRTPFVCEGYISKEGNITRKSRPFLDADGQVKGEWHLTGDRAYRDKDGYLWFIGRSDDVINSSGYRIGKSICSSLSIPFDVNNEGQDLSKLNQR